MKEVPVCPQPTEPTIIRKYITTKTTTTHQGMPPNIMPTQQPFEHLQHSSSASNIPKENVVLINGNKFQSSSNQQSHVRSSSIPNNQQRGIDEVFSTMNSSAPGNTTTRYYTTRNYTTSNAEQQQQQLANQQKQEMQSTSNQTANYISQQQKRKQTSSCTSTSAHQGTKTHTLPVNFTQQATSGYQTNGNAANRNSNSSSCIDYSNTFYNSDWKMRHGNIEKPSTTIPVKTISTPTSIPIYQQHPNQSNIAYSLDGIVMQ